MKLLLDTCTFLWVVNETDRVPRKVLELFQAEENEVYLSAASAWEITLKYARGSLRLPTPPAHFVPTERDGRSIAPLAIDEEAALHLAKLPPLHRDPFDRILVSQAIVHGLGILTPDPLITQYPARTIW